MSDRHDDMAERVEDLPVAAVDWPPDRRDLVETIRVMNKAGHTFWSFGAAAHEDEGRSGIGDGIGPIA